MNRYQQELEQRSKDYLLRTLPAASNKIDFYSNDYLGFSQSEELYQSISNEYDSIQPKRTGSTGSRLLSGNSAYVESVENLIADFHKVESALLFVSGYSANVGLISALGKRGTNIISDELVHASMIDGVRLSHAIRHKFKHNDVYDLNNRLANISGEKIVLIESIYSMDGDIAPIADILAVCKKNDAQLVVDEAHAIGMIGKRGEGMCSSMGIQNEVLATVVTFGKAMGTHGAAVLSQNWLTIYLINFSRSFIYSTAPSNHQLASIKCSYEINARSEKSRMALQNNIAYFVSRRKDLSQLNWLNSGTAIQSLIIQGNKEVVSLADELNANGITILPIRSPSVPVGQERLRISMHAYNTKEEIDLLFEVIEKWYQAK